MIPHNKPTIGEEESAAIARIVESGWIAQGEKVKEFEDAISAYHGLPKGSAVAVSSGTAALYLALHALGVGEESEVIVPTYVCSAVLNAVNMTGAAPALVDIDADDLNLSFVEVKKKITKRTRAIVVTHTFGMPADVSSYLPFDIPIIEDCAQAIGATVGGHRVGAQGAVTIFSFYATKMLTTGYGGMVMSRGADLIRKMLDYREFDGRTDYKPRFNFQMSDMQAAMGLVQLRRLPSFLKRREEIAALYRTLVPQKLQLWPSATKEHRANFYRVLLRTNQGPKLKEFLDAKGITTTVPIERFELLHRYLRMEPKKFPAAEDAAGHTLSLPAYPSLTDDEVRSIAAGVSEFFANV